MSRFKVGDRVRIREWDDMAAEFGFNNDFQDSIDVRYGFTEDMKYLCGREFTVAKITEDGRFISEGDSEDGWSITEGMLELIGDDISLIPIEDGDISISELLCSCNDNLGQLCKDGKL